jgi:hypothetical protein
MEHTLWVARRLFSTACASTAERTPVAPDPIAQLGRQPFDFASCSARHLINAPHNGGRHQNTARGLQAPRPCQILGP